MSQVSVFEVVEGLVALALGMRMRSRSLPQLGMSMAELAHGTQPEFWRPPSPMVEEVTVQEPTPGMMEACPKCGTEFLLGSRFCHTCGRKRPLVMSAGEQADAAAVPCCGNKSFTTWVKPFALSRGDASNSQPG